MRTTVVRPIAAARPGLLARFARTMYRRRRRVVAAWVVVLVGVSVLAGAVPGDHRADYTIPGSDSAAAQRLLADRFPDQSGDAVDLVFHAPRGVTSPAVVARMAAVKAAVARAPHVAA